MKILVLVTSHALLGNSGEPTGLWLEELAAPYIAFTRAGATVDIASPNGGEAPIDPRSTKAPSADVQAFLANPKASAALHATKRLRDVGSDYDAVFVAGGHGTMWDLPDDPTVGSTLSNAWKRGAVVAAVCHGPAALVGARDINGEPLIKGRRFTAFSNDEEVGVKLANIVPFLLETRLTEQGGRYEKGSSWQPYTVRDGRLITGQNPASSKVVAELVIGALREAHARK